MGHIQAETLNKSLQWASYGVESEKISQQQAQKKQKHEQGMSTG